MFYFKKKEDGSVKTIRIDDETYSENGEYDSLGPIDFIKIDTEGYELEILKGLNISKYRPKYMLVEITNDYDNITEFFTKNNYKLHSNFSNYNFIDNPGWDGTHNDYLFIDNL